MLGEFRDFIAKGNVMDMAVGIIVGAAFTGIVSSVVSDLLNPIIGLFMGGFDFTNNYAVLAGDVPEASSLEAARPWPKSPRMSPPRCPPGRRSSTF